MLKSVQMISSVCRIIQKRFVAIITVVSFAHFSNMLITDTKLSIPDKILGFVYLQQAGPVCDI